MGLSENTQGEIGWKHVDRNIVGFIEASLIIIFYIHFCESLQYACKAHSKTVGIVFWTLTPLTIIGILVLNILKFGPFLDSIGYIVAAVILFIGSLDSYFFYNEEEDRKNIIWNCKWFLFHLSYKYMKVYKSRDIAGALGRIFTPWIHSSA